MGKDKSVKIDTDTYNKLNKLKDETGIPVKTLIKKAVDAETEKTENESK